MGRRNGNARKNKLIRTLKIAEMLPEPEPKPEVKSEVFRVPRRDGGYTHSFQTQRKGVG